MSEQNKTYLRETLEQMPTWQLDDLLMEKSMEEPVDEETLRLILQVLREREKHRPATADGSAPVRERGASGAAPKTRKKGGWIPKAVAAAAVILLVALAVFPQEAEAKGVFERLASWTDSIFELFAPGSSRDNRDEYVFKTDNPGLQEVYDQLTELGVDVPVVPMWLPEGYELLECKILNTPSKTGITAKFSNGNNSMNYVANRYLTNEPNKFYKDKNEVEKYEINGTAYNIIHNENLWVVIWIVDNLECSISIDCQEDILFDIIWSIYGMEDM